MEGISLQASGCSIGVPKENPKKPHSTPVPQIYKISAKVLEKYIKHKGSLKTVLYQSCSKLNEQLINRLNAVLSNVIKQYSSVEKVLNAVKLFEEQPRFNKFLAYILTSELLRKNGPLPGTCKPVCVINSYETTIRKHFEITEDQEGCDKAIVPRYVRLNIHLESRKNIKDALQNLGYNYMKYSRHKTTYDEFLNMVANLDQYSYLKDYHVQNLLVFSPKQPFWQTDLYKNGVIILQDKASCLPVFISGVQPGESVIDACAAPGNKTAHLANLMACQGRLIAVDRNKRRYKEMKDLLTARKIEGVETKRKDFTSMDPMNYPDVTTILVDPSCSASGTTVHGETVPQERIDKLSWFQLKALCHAFTFPNVKTIVYSTCSIIADENEVVVEAALSKFGEEFELEDLRNVLPEWKHFGRSSYDCGPYCLTTNTAVDMCHGFFIAKFVRKVQGDSDILKGEKRKLETSPEKQKKKRLIE